MSLATKNAFKRSVEANHAANASRLSLLPPAFADEGFVTTAIMYAPGGKVELRCGPAEYHVDLSIHNDAGLNRWSLSELIALPKVREWMQANRAELEGKQRVEAEVEYAFRLLRDALGRVPELAWLLREAAPLA